MLSSPPAYRCRIAFNLKGVEADFVPIHLRRGEQKKEAYSKVNPQGLVPALAVDGDVLTQSLAIIEWLEETHPRPPLLPHDACNLGSINVARCARGDDGQRPAIDWNELERGGHFAAFEQPEMFVDEVRAFFRLVR